MKKTAFLFPGQGAQYPGMGLDIIEVSPQAMNVFKTASDVLERDIIKLIRDSDAQTLKRTDVSQITINAASLAAAAFLRERGIVPEACAGFSLGEYPALAQAGVISIEDCFRLTNERGIAMQAAADCIKTGSGEAPGMAAVMGLQAEKTQELIAEWKISDLYAANINSSKQTVVSGSAAALAEAEIRFKEAGAKRVIRLQVAGPFHSPLMKKAADAFSPALEKITFNDPQTALFSNVTGRKVLCGEEAKKLALLHITSPVRWTEEQASIAQSGIEVCLETGPGAVLQGLWKDTGSSIPIFAAGRAEDILKTGENA